DLVPTGLGCVLVLTDEQQDSSPQRPEGVESLERLTERCESALSLLGGALHSLETEPLPQSTKVVSLSVAKHKQLMMDVLADQRLTELQRGGGAWLAGLTSRGTEPALRSQDCRAALAVTSDLYNSVDDALHRLVRVSNQRGRDLETLGKLVALEERLDQELHRETHSVLGQLERWAELEWAGREWAGLEAVLERLPPVRERLRDISHCLSDCWTQMDSTQRLLSTLTEAASSSSMWDLLGADGELEGEGEGDWGGLQSWGSLASLFRPQNCSTLKIGDERKKDTAAGGGGFLQALLHPAKKSPPEAALPPKPPRKRHPSFDLQALLAPRRGPANSRPGDLPAATSRSAPMSWLGRKALVDPVLSIGVAAALPGDGAAGGATSGAGSVLIRGVEVSSKEVVDHTGSPRQHVLLSRAERETGGERQGTTAQSKICQLWCRLLSSERQYVALLKGVEENYLPPLDCPDAPAHLRGKWDSLFANWSNLCAFHTQHLLPAMEGALTQTLLLQDCFSKFKEEFLQYSHYIRTKPDPDSALVNQAADFFRVRIPYRRLASRLIMR
ncbi:hypothetical protein Z043_121639, partial [Scleropages formosus]